MLSAAGVVWSQTFPAKPVRVIVPFPPAGANDIVARIVFPKVSEQMGQQFIIDNRPGAGGTIGSAIVAQSKPDGYTLLIQTAASHVSNPHLYTKLPTTRCAISSANVTLSRRKKASAASDSAPAAAPVSPAVTDTCTVRGDAMLAKGGRAEASASSSNGE